MEFVDDAILNRVRVLIERTRGLHGLSAADQAAMDQCWSVLASIEVPYALARITGTPSQHPHEGFAGEFFDAMHNLVDAVRSVVDEFEDDETLAVSLAEARQAHDDTKIAALITGRSVLDDCHYTTTLLETAEINAMTDLGTPGGSKTVQAIIDNRRNKTLAKRNTVAKTTCAQGD